MSLVQSSSHRSWAIRITLTAAIVAAIAWAIFRFTTAPIVARQNGASNPKSAPAISLAGNVRSSVSGSLHAANVCAYGREANSGLDRYCAAADSQGQYRLELRPGIYSVTASADNHGSVTSTVTIGESRAMRLDFTLESQAPTIAGVVSSAAGARISAARLSVYRGALLISNVLTDSKGAFSASTQSGEFILKVEADGYGATIVRTVAPTMDVFVTLYPGNVVSGQVLLDGSLQPVPNVHVTATGNADRIVSELRDSAVQTDEHGNFTFPSLTTGAWTLTVADRHVWGAVPQPVVVTGGKEERGIILLVVPAGEIVGRFVVTGTGQPCRSGRMQLIPEAVARKAASHPDGEITQDEPEPNRPAPIPLFTAVTDDVGTVRFGAVPYGAYRLGPSCDQHQLTGGPRTLEVTRDITEQLWEFSAGLGMTVRVVDEAGKPIENAAVAMSLQGEQGLSRGQIVMSQRVGMTDMQGNYRFGALRAGQYQLSARYSAVNGKSMVTENVDLQSGVEPVPITLALPGAGTVRIHAHTSTGASISRILFFALDSNDARYEGAYGGDGRFTIGPLPRDSYRVFGYDNKNPKIPLNNGVPLLVAGTDPIDLDFNYEEPNASLQGRVVDSNGKPLSGVYVRAVSSTLDEQDERYSTIQVSLHGGQEQMTDHAGAFRIEGLRNQALYDVYVDHSSGLKEKRNGVSPGAYLEIALPAPASLIGSVVDAAGKPVDKFDVVFGSSANNDTRSQSFAKTGGRFKIEDIYPGPIHITIYSGDGDLNVNRDTTVAAGQVLNVGQFVLAATRTGEVAAQADR